MLRRVLPRFARELTVGLGAHAYATGHVGISFERGDRQQWPAEQSAAGTLDSWTTRLLAGFLPWPSGSSTWEEDEAVHEELTSWFARHAPARLCAHGASGELLEDVRLLGVPGPARAEDPHRQVVRRRVEAAATPPRAAPAAPPAPEPDRTAAPG
ncbi:hypothetical protein [Streptomyces sp. 147326]|uniref:hypothetical protein n=1 Tax=Streptomyces sp. 147326 TaxID=3074379 RepID=UPI003857668A